MIVWPRESSRIESTASRRTDRPFCRLESLGMFGNQCFAQPLDIGQRRIVDEQLIRVRPAIVPYGNRLASPNELCPHSRAKYAQRRKVRSLGRPSRVPSQPSIGKTAKRLPIVWPSKVNCSASGDSGAASSGFITWNLGADGQCILPQFFRRFETRDSAIDAHGRLLVHACNRCQISASTAQSESGRRGFLEWVESQAIQPRNFKNCAALCL